MKRKRTNPEFLNGVPELLILQLLSRRPMYGYELLQEIRVSTGRVLEFGEGCIYPLLHRLEAQSLLSSERRMVQGRQRIVYTISRKGSTKLSQAALHWRQTVEAVARVLQGGQHGQPALA